MTNFYECAEAIHSLFPVSCYPFSSYTEFYVLFMLCKRCPIIVKISKQIVKIDLPRLPIDLQSPANSPNGIFICGVLRSRDACQSSESVAILKVSVYLPSICILCLYLYLHRGSCVCMPMPAAPTRRSS